MPMLFPFLLTFSFNFCYKRYINSLKSLDMSNSQGPLDVEEIVARYVTLGGPESNGRHIKSTPIGIIRDLSVTTPAGLEQGTDLLSNLYSTCFPLNLSNELTAAIPSIRLDLKPLRRGGYERNRASDGVHHVSKRRTLLLNTLFYVCVATVVILKHDVVDRESRSRSSE